MPRNAVVPAPKPEDSKPRLPLGTYEAVIDDRLDRTRRHVKSVDVMAGCLALAVGVLVYLGLTTLLDHWVFTGGLGFQGRLILWSVLVVGVTSFFVGRIFLSLVRRVNPLYAAQAIEQSRPAIKNSIINFLLLRRERQQVPTVVYEAIEQRAANDMRRVTVDTTVDRAHVLRLSYMLAGVVLILVLYLVISPKNPLVSFQRMVWPWADVMAPTRVVIENIEPGDASMFLGEFASVAADVSGLKQGEGVTLYYTTADNQIVGAAVPLTVASEGYRWRCVLPPGSLGLQQDLEYYLAAGDGRTRTFHIQAQVNPVIVVDRVDYHYPPYTGIADESIEREGNLRAVEGTQVTLHATANQEIARAEIDLDCTGKPGVVMKSQATEATGRFVLSMKSDATDEPEYTSYQLRFTDTHKRQNHQPIRHRIEVLRDLPPEVQIVEPAEEEVAVAENGQLDIRVRAVDPDFGLRHVVLRLQNKGTDLTVPPLLRKMFPAEPHKGEFRGSYRFEPAKLGLKAGDLVTCWAEAEDNRATDDNQPKANRTESHTHRIAIVAGQPHRAAGGKSGPGQNGPRQPGNQDQRPGGPRDQAQNHQPPDPQANDQPRQEKKRSESSEGSAKTDAAQDQRPDAADKSSDQNEPVDPKTDPGTAFERMAKFFEEQEKKQDHQNQPDKSPDGSQQHAANQDQNQSGEKSSTPGKSGEKVSTPGKSGEKVATPDKKGDEKAGTPNKKDGQKVATPDKKDGQKIATPDSKTDDKVATPDKKKSREKAITPDKSGQQALSEQKKSQQAAGQQQSETQRQAGQQAGDQGKSDQQTANQQKNTDQPGGQKQADAQSKPSQQAGEQGKSDQQTAGEQKNADQPGGQKQAGDQSKPSQQAGEQGKSSQQQASRKQQKPGESQKSSSDQAKSDQKSGAEGGEGKAGQQSAGAQTKPDQQAGERGGPSEKSDQASSGGESKGEKKSDGSKSQIAKADQEASGKAGEKGQQDKPESKPGEQLPGSKDERGQSSSRPSPDKEASEQAKSSERSDSAQMDKTAQKSDAKAANKEKTGSTASPETETAGNKAAAKPEERATDKPSGGGDPLAGPKKPDSRQNMDGDRSGGGGKSAGQQAKQSGSDQAGSQSPGDQGAPQGNQPGEAQTGQRAGDQARSKDRTGESTAQTPGANTRPGEKSSEGKAGQERPTSDDSQSKAAKSASDGPSNKTGQSDQAGKGKVAGNPVTGGQPNQPNEIASLPPEDEPGGDEANLEYAAKQTDLVLQALREQLNKGQPDPELLKRLGNWSRRDLDDFYHRWEQMKRAADDNSPKAGDARKEFRNALRSLGLRPKGTVLEGGKSERDQLHNMNESRRAAPPPNWAPLLKAYTEGVAGQK
jgi:hypothetical protein